MQKFTIAALAGAAFLIVTPFSQAQPEKLGAVNVAGVSVRNLNREEATRRLGRELAPKLKTKITLAAGPRAIAKRRSDVGAELDLGWMLTRAASGQKFVPLKLRVN